MSKKKKKQKSPKAAEIQQVILFSDPNGDADDLISFVAAASLAEKGLMKLRAVIATGGDLITRIRRARFTKGIFIKLGLPFLKVAIGREYERIPGGHDNFYAEYDFGKEMELQGAVVDRNSLVSLQLLIKNAEDKSFTLIANAPMSDLAVFLQNCGEKNFKKIYRLIIMGGAAVETDENGLLIPDENSYNNKMCLEAAKEVFRLAQENNIRLVLVPKELVYQLQVGRNFYEKLEQLKNPVAKAIAESNKICLEALWNSVKAGDFSHFDLRRFAKIFMDENYKISSRQLNAHKAFSEIWPQIKYFNLYDVLTVVTAAEKYFKQFGKYKRISENYSVYEPEIEDKAAFMTALDELIYDRLAINPLSIKLGLFKRDRKNSDAID